MQRLRSTPSHGDGISTSAFAVFTSTSTWFSSTVLALGHAPRDDLGVLQALAEVGQQEVATSSRHQYSVTRVDGGQDPLDVRHVVRSIVAGGYGVS